MTSRDIELEPHTRGDTFAYSTTLGNGWVAGDFTGGLKFTVRSYVPATSTLDDADALDAVSVAGGGIVASGTSVTVTIAASRTTLWPAKRLYWDLQGVVAGPTPLVYTIAGGTIRVMSDVTRSTA